MKVPPFEVPLIPAALPRIIIARQNSFLGGNDGSLIKSTLDLWLDSALLQFLHNRMMKKLDRTPGSATQIIEKAVGFEVRRLREEQGLSNLQLAKAAKISTGMLSKIEHGLTSPSLTTLEALARALNLPMATLFQKLGGVAHVAYTREGGGIGVHNRAKKAMRCELLGKSPPGPVILQPLLLTISSHTDEMPVLSKGVALIYVLEGSITYSHLGRDFVLRRGDSLVFDASTFHWIAKVDHYPTKLLIVGSYLNRAFLRRTDG